MFDGLLICHFINIIGGTYMLLFITFFGEMVIAESIATWYWTMNKDTIPKLTVFRSVSSTTQYVSNFYDCSFLKTCIETYIYICKFS